MTFVTLPLEPVGFRRAMGQFATGVGLITVQAGTRIHGMTANAITSVSLDPLLILICIGKQTTLAGLLRECGTFSVNFLTRDQEAVAQHFAGARRPGGPPDVRFEPWQCGPRLVGSLAVLGCRLHELVDAGDHWVVIGRVVALAEGSAAAHAPLVFYRGRYRGLSPEVAVPATPAPDLMSSTGASLHYGEWE